ncbi:hypothetical protein DN069_05820 [Streptacidiphilus pinicola]|uniref:DUF6745 domain-containing protein n=1 Tax=Streptacidiphilus pinicola TaxID=2219663 RepID=A0A2X0IN44_9ACTN|nr:hypothetical protein [Streptacidiphilus pinicola]RAG86574.1 hypothetical protein DN069_05820 [Streptacidiphilus pinicola]
MTTEQDDWARIGRRVGPADRAAAEAGVRAAYRLAGLAEPRAVVWCESPLVAAAAALQLTSGTDGLTGPLAERARVRARRLLAEHGFVAPGSGERTGLPEASVRDLVRTGPWQRARGRLVAELGRAGWSERWTSASGALWPRLHGLTQRICDAVVDGLTGPEAQAGVRPDHERSAVRLVLLDAVPGQQDAAWLAALADDPELAGHRAVARSAGWWWPYTEVALLVERPVALELDEAGRLHRGDGPALAYADGFALHAWRGMPVPGSLFARLADLTVEEIRAEPNAAVRRVMLEHFGHDRYLAESGGRAVHRDETGVLWRIELPGDEPLVMVEVTDSTPEPDGSRRVHWLRVPPGTGTAREGVAWTFGLPPEAYRPRSQT